MKKNATPLARIDNAPKTLRDIVQSRMREAIIDGHFAPGDRLVERPLCEQLGVSRTVVRETIRYLEAEGLVEILPNRGPIVATLSWNQAKQIYDIRLLLEASAAAACTNHQRDAFTQQLAEALARVEHALDDKEWSNLLQATSAFYELIFVQAEHIVAWEVVQRLNGRISRLRALTLSARKRDKSGLSHLKAIFDAVSQGTADQAKTAVERHITDAAQKAEKLLLHSDTSALSPLKEAHHA